MTSSFSHRPGLDEDQDEAIEKVLGVINPSYIPNNLRVSEVAGLRNLRNHTDVVTDIPSRVASQAIRKVLGMENPLVPYKATPATSATMPKKHLVLPYLMSLCNKERKCRLAWARQGDLANHFKIHHPNALKTEEHWECCDESYTSADKCLKHVWEAHMEFNTPYSSMSTNFDATRTADSPASTTSYPPLHGAADGFEFSSTSSHASPYMSSAGPSLIVSRSSATPPSSENGLHTPSDYNMDWPYNIASQDQSHIFDTVRIDQYAALNFDLSDFDFTQYRP